MSTSNRQLMKLGFSVQPYIGMGIVCVLWLAMLIFIAAHEKTWTLLLEIGWLPPLLFAGWVFIGTRYRVLYDDKRVEMTASGRASVSILYDEIVSVAKEASIERGRPFRRIAIHADSNFIDVSLKHFAIDDVRNLMRVIHEKRPGLALPEISR